MENNKYHLYKSEEQDNYFYLEMNDISDAAVQIWESPEGGKKTFIRIKITEPEWEKILDEYKHIQIVQKTIKRVEI